MQVETTPAYNFVGEHTDGVTPVPIPNTAVKPVRPMIVPLARKSVIAGILQTGRLELFVQGVFFCAHFWIVSRQFDVPVDCPYQRIRVSARLLHLSDAKPVHDDHITRDFYILTTPLPNPTPIISPSSPWVLISVG